ncbi:MAG: DUF2004 domain-containing protein [Clostridia bacterium]|nr:DUF2004 domain-containing protein [Clostridia bacterium]
MGLFNTFRAKENKMEISNNKKVLEINENLKINLKYEESWFGKLQYNFGKIKSNNIDVQIDSYDSEKNLDEQKETLRLFFDEWNNIENKIIDASYNYYNSEREKLGYDIEKNEDYPELKDVSEIIDMIEIIGITVPEQDDSSERAISIVFNCTWEREHGMGICLVNNNVIEIGYQDIAL